MNDKPHTHVPRVTRRWESFDSGEWIVVYGDTRWKICAEWRTPTKRLITKATRKAIARHDKGSRQAEIKKTYSEIANQIVSEWGSDGVS